MVGKEACIQEVVEAELGRVVGMAVVKDKEVYM